MVLSWISRTLSPQIAESVVYINIAQKRSEKIWERDKEIIFGSHICSKICIPQNREKEMLINFLQIWKLFGKS